jgi:hypothetical protein
MRSFAAIPLVASMLLPAGCATTPPPKDFVNADMNGRINGKEWRYAHAYIDPTIATPEEEDLVFIFLAYKPKEPCPKVVDPGKDPRTVMVSAPKNRKITPLKGGTARNLVFHTQQKAQQYATVAKIGKIKLTSITDRSVRGKIYGTFNDGNWVSGNFTAVLCDYQDLQ